MALRIVFMGTPEFAVPALSVLLQHGYEVVGVVTSTDKLGGRGKKQLLESAVKKFAVEHGIPVIQPTKLKSPEFLAELKALKADLQIVVAFRMLPELVWGMPEKGTINLHASLLPKYRGAAPINWAIIRGEKQTGLTTFYINERIDTGDLLFQAKVPIKPDDTAGDLHDRMMETGAELVLKTVKAIGSGTAKPVSQTDTKATSAPKIFHETCQIDFGKSTGKVYDFIRGLSPYPAAWTLLNGKELKVLAASPEFDPGQNLAPGSIVTDNKSRFAVATKDGFIAIEELKLEGRRRMNVRDFLNGYPLEEKMVGFTSQP